MLDVETTIFQKGNPFAKRNALCYVGTYSQGTHNECDLSGLIDVQRQLDESSLLVGFNIKFDLHWLRRYGLTFKDKGVWDCQFVHFILQAQRDPYPSLDGVCAHYSIPGKFGHIAENYWLKGIDTPDIPVKEITEYLSQDVRCTWEVYQRQKVEVDKNPLLRNLIKLHMDDLLVLQEMEFNGLKFNTEVCLQEKEKVEKRLEEIDKQLSSRYPNTPLNWDSGDDVSAYLFGGVVTEEKREPNGVFVSGQKKGLMRFKKVVLEHNLTRLLDPIQGSELAKADKEKGTGPWSTAEDVLKQCKQIVEIKLLLERAALSKLLDYLAGWPSLIVEKDWKANEVHGQFNQVRARTGRLSSSSPNLQNLPDPVLKLVETRYV